MGVILLRGCRNTAELADAALGGLLALALYSAGDHASATTRLLDLTTRHAPVGEYARALSHYRDTLGGAVTKSG